MSSGLKYANGQIAFSFLEDGSGFSYYKTGARRDARAARRRGAQTAAPRRRLCAGHVGVDALRLHRNSSNGFLKSLITARRGASKICEVRSPVAPKYRTMAALVLLKGQLIFPAYEKAFGAALDTPAELVWLGLANVAASACGGQATEREREGRGRTSWRAWNQSS